MMKKYFLLIIKDDLKKFKLIIIIIVKENFIYFYKYFPKIKIKYIYILNKLIFLIYNNVA